MSCCHFENSIHQNLSLLSQTLQCCPRPESASVRLCLGHSRILWLLFLHVSRATISLKLVLRPTDEWQEPGIVTNNDYYYSENRAWNEPARANMMYGDTYSFYLFSFTLLSFQKIQRPFYLNPSCSSSKFEGRSIATLSLFSTLFFSLLSHCLQPLSLQCV